MARSEGRTTLMVGYPHGRQMPCPIAADSHSQWTTSSLHPIADGVDPEAVDVGVVRVGIRLYQSTRTFSAIWTDASYLLGFRPPANSNTADTKWRQFAQWQSCLGPGCRRREWLFPWMSYTVISGAVVWVQPVEAHRPRKENSAMLKAFFMPSRYAIAHGRVTYSPPSALFSSALRRARCMGFSPPDP